MELIEDCRRIQSINDIENNLDDDDDLSEQSIDKDEYKDFIERHYKDFDLEKM